MIIRTSRPNWLTSTWLAWLLSTLFTMPLSAYAGCSASDDPISTDRPSTANSSATIPKGSLQLENGMTETHDQSIWTIDLPETRMRVGLADCTEVLVDFPDYYRSNVASGSNGASNGTSNIGTAIKHQFPDWVNGFTFSGTLGVFLDTGNSALAGAGPNPYAQSPWSYDLGSSWSVNGMFGILTQRHALNSNSICESTLYLDRSINDKSDMFIEYGINEQKGTTSIGTWGVGGSYRFMPMQQVDFKLGSGVNNAAPSFYLSIGYSVRFNRLF